MKLRLLLAGLLLAASTSTVMAASGPYIGASGGLSTFHDRELEIPGSNEEPTISYKAGYGLNAAAGYKLNAFRLEAEFGYKFSKLKSITHPAVAFPPIKGNLTIMSYMVNGYYDMNLGSPSFTPFIGGGLGLLNGELEGTDTNYKNDDNVLGFNVTLGGSYNINKNVSFDVYYRFQGAATPFEVLPSGVKVNYGSSDVFGGLRYNF